MLKGTVPQRMQLKQRNYLAQLRIALLVTKLVVELGSQSVTMWESSSTKVLQFQVVMQRT